MTEPRTRRLSTKGEIISHCKKNFATDEDYKTLKDILRLPDLPEPDTKKRGRKPTIKWQCLHELNNYRTNDDYLKKVLQKLETT